MDLRIDMDHCLPALHLMHSRKKCRRLVERLGWKWDPLEADALTMCGWGGDGDFHAVVLMEADSSWHADAALLAHESVHVAEATARQLGVDDEEFLAYMVQGVSQALFEGHDRWKRKHGPSA